MVTTDLIDGVCIEFLLKTFVALMADERKIFTKFVLFVLFLQMNAVLTCILRIYSKNENYFE